MIAFAVLLLSLALATLVYALWPTARAGVVYDTDPGTEPVKALYRRVAHGWFGKWQQRYEYTGGQTKNPRTVGVVMLAVITAVFLATVLTTHSVFIAVLLAAAVGFAPWMLLGMQSRKRERAMNTQLVDFIDMVRGGLETHDLTEAVRDAAVNTEPPLSHEMAILVSELDSRVPLSDALQHLANRNQSRSMAFTAATLDIAATTGSTQVASNLAALSRMIRTNERTAQDIRSKTLILRVSAKLFVIIPSVALLLSLAAFGTEPWTTPVGIGGIVFILGSAVGSVFLFNWLQRWQIGE